MKKTLNILILMAFTFSLTISLYPTQAHAGIVQKAKAAVEKARRGSKPVSHATAAVRG